MGNKLDMLCTTHSVFHHVKLRCSLSFQFQRLIQPLFTWTKTLQKGIFSQILMKAKWLQSYLNCTAAPINIKAAMMQFKKEIGSYLSCIVVPLSVSGTAECHQVTHYSCVFFTGEVITSCRLLSAAQRKRGLKISIAFILQNINITSAKRMGHP